jgi:hypothetical protein
MKSIYLFIPTFKNPRQAQEVSFVRTVILRRTFGLLFLKRTDAGGAALRNRYPVEITRIPQIRAGICAEGICAQMKIAMRSVNESWYGRYGLGFRHPFGLV